MRLPGGNKRKSGGLPGFLKKLFSFGNTGHDESGRKSSGSFSRKADKSNLLMGANRTHAKTQVIFNYLLAETDIAVIANVYPGNYAQIIERKPTESELDTHVEIVSAAYRWQGKTVAWDDIPAFIAADIEAHAMEVWRKKYNEA